VCFLHSPVTSCPLGPSVLSSLFFFKFSTETTVFIPKFHTNLKQQFVMVFSYDSLSEGETIMVNGSDLYGGSHFLNLACV